MANKHRVEIAATKPGVDTLKWMYTFSPPEPQFHSHNDAPPIGFMPPPEPVRYAAVSRVGGHDEQRRRGANAATIERSTRR